MKYAWKKQEVKKTEQNELNDEEVQVTVISPGQ
jgi:hypothetical protein